MKQLKITVILAVMLVAFLIGYNAGNNNKDYEAACFYGDVLHSLMGGGDSVASEVDNTYGEWLNILEDLNFKDLTKDDLDKYYWCY